MQREPDFLLLPHLQKIRWNREANGYRLPTEAEWEYAAKAGSKDPYWGHTIDDVAWHKLNCTQPEPVGAKYPNPWGIFDLLGNVQEWVWDARKREDTKHPCTGHLSMQAFDVYRLHRGGNWRTLPDTLHPSARGQGFPFQGFDFSGLRLARNLYH